MNDVPVSARIVQKLGFISFVTMSSLIVVCIMFGFYAVVQQAKIKPVDWKQACVQAGGVPVKLGEDYYDCKVLAATKEQI